ncbi:MULTISPECIES: enoyl-CoA hydratase/isomerase family protein [Prauserella]|nr:MULTISPECIES: enoyl-CoA hydratase-related protein [Prauserella]PXY25178.1 hypothetical protein BAY59_24465 [Prauserella coralliicola]
MSESTIEVEEHEGVATVWLARPDALNTINKAVAKDLRATGYRLAAKRDLRAVVIRGRGSCFSAGGDVTMFSDHMDDIATYMLDVIPDFHEFLLTLRGLSASTVAAVHGVAAGGGLSLALACDFVVAESGARFATAYRKLGATADGGITHSLTHLVGPRRALDLMLRSDGIGAEEAVAIGLINRHVPAADFDAELSSLVSSLVVTSPLVVREVRNLVHGAVSSTFAAQLRAETSSFVRSAETMDFREGVAAFMDKRTPVFVGR